MGPSLAMLGPSWGYLGPSVGRIGAVLAPVLGPSWGPLWRFWGCIGPSSCRLGLLLGRLGSLFWSPGLGCRPLASPSFFLQLYRLFRHSEALFDIVSQCLGTLSYYALPVPLSSQVFPGVQSPRGDPKVLREPKVARKDPQGSPGPGESMEAIPRLFQKSGLGPHPLSFPPCPARHAGARNLASPV